MNAIAFASAELSRRFDDGDIMKGMVLGSDSCENLYLIGNIVYFAVRRNMFFGIIVVAGINFWFDFYSYINVINSFHLKF